MMKRLKKALQFLKISPLLCLLTASGLLFGALGLWGRQGLYRELAGGLLEQPAGAVVFLGAKEGIYPWELPGERATETGEALSGPETDAPLPDGARRIDAGQPADVNVAGSGGQLAQVTEEQALDMALQREEAAKQERKNEAAVFGGTVSGDTLSENTVSGDTAWEDPDPGAVYSFTQVDDSYFDDALFIGDSRMVGLQDYTALAEHADFFVRTSLTVWEIFSEPKAFVKEEDTGKKLTIEEALAKKKYGKIYLMVGINELGRGTPQSFAREYEKVLNRLQEMQPQALIFIQAIMHVGKEKDETDPIFNNSNIVSRNDAISIFANNHNIFYLDGNGEVCDEEGNLKADWTFDQVHLLGVYYDKWREYLLTKGVVREGF